MVFVFVGECLTDTSLFQPRQPSGNLPTRLLVTVSFRPRHQGVTQLLETRLANEIKPNKYETMKPYKMNNCGILKAGCAVLALALVASASVRAEDRERQNEHGHDRVVLSFSTVGDSRQDPASPDPTTLPLSGQDAIWLQNTRALDRISRSVEYQGSSFLFFNGDMIMGYGNATSPKDTNVATVVSSDLMAFYRQYGFWRGMMAGLMEGGTYVVPVPGNHETQWKKAPLSGGGTGKRAQVVNENAWRANMGDLILDTNRFQNLFGEQPTFMNVGDNSLADGLTSDQSKLSYSFDFRGCHFAIINTDPAGNDAHAPTNWLSADFADAKARGAQHFFVFGHKPAFTYNYGVTNDLPGSPAGLDNDPASRDVFWSIIESYGATYFCGHEHIFHMEQPTAATGGKAWQVLVGSGGSPFEAAPTDLTANPETDRSYAWATVTVMNSGKVRITVFGFDDQFGPTKVLRTVVLN